MNQNLLSRVLEFLRRKMWNKRWQRAVTCLGAVAVFGVTYALILPAITMTGPHPEIHAEQLTAWTGDELTVHVIAETAAGENEKVHVISMEENGAALSEKYLFDEEGIAVIQDKEGREIELHRVLRDNKENVVDYWFVLEEGTRAEFDLELADEPNEDRFGETIQKVKRSVTSDETATAANAVKSGAVSTASNAAKTASVSDASKTASLSNAVLTETDDDGFEQLVDSEIINDLGEEEEEAGVEITAVLKVSVGSGRTIEDADKDADRNADKRGNAQLKFRWKTEAAPEPEMVWSDKGATIAVFYDDDAEIPKDAVLAVKEIREGTEDYQLYYDQTKTFINYGEENEKSVNDARFFDITILDANGIAVEPEAPVKVVISYEEPVKVGKDGTLNVVHFDSDDGIQMVTPDAADGEEKVGAVRFSTDSFSVYGLFGSREIATKILTAEGATYTVRVRCNPEANIPEDAQLTVSEVPENSEEYIETVSKVKKELNQDKKKQVSYVKALDIKIVSNGEIIEPDVPIQISIDYESPSGSQQPKEIKIVHFGSEGTEIPELKEIVRSEEKNTVVFDQKGFSITTINELRATSQNSVRIKLVNNLKDAMFTTPDQFGVTDITVPAEHEFALAPETPVTLDMVQSELDRKEEGVTDDSNDLIVRSIAYNGTAIHDFKIDDTGSFMYRVAADGEYQSGVISKASVNVIPKYKQIRVDPNGALQSRDTDRFYIGTWTRKDGTPVSGISYLKYVYVPNGNKDYKYKVADPESFPGTPTISGTDAVDSTGAGSTDRAAIGWHVYHSGWAWTGKDINPKQYTIAASYQPGIVYWYVPGSEKDNTAPDYPDENGKYPEIDGHPQGLVQARKTASWVNKTAGIGKITLTAGAVPVYEGADVVIVLDISESMATRYCNSGKTEREYDAKTAAWNAVETLFEKKEQNNRVAITSFREYLGPDIWLQTYDDKNKLKGYLKELEAWGYNTNYHAGLRDAINILNNRTAEDKQKRRAYVLFITDGAPNTNNEYIAGDAQALADAGVTTFAIGIEMGSSNNYMKMIANNKPENIFLLRQVSDMHNVLQRIVQEIQYSNNAHFHDIISECFNALTNEELEALAAEGLVAPGTKNSEGVIIDDAHHATVDAGVLDHSIEEPETFDVYIRIDFANQEHVNRVDTEPTPTNDDINLTYTTPAGQDMTINKDQIGDPKLTRGQNYAIIEYYRVNEKGEYMTIRGATVSDALKNTALLKTITTPAIDTMDQPYIDFDVYDNGSDDPQGRASVDPDSKQIKGIMPDGYERWSGDTPTVKSTRVLEDYDSHPVTEFKVIAPYTIEKAVIGASEVQREYGYAETEKVHYQLTLTSTAGEQMMRVNVFDEILLDDGAGHIENAHGIVTPDPDNSSNVQWNEDTKSFTILQMEPHEPVIVKYYYEVASEDVGKHIKNRAYINGIPSNICTVETRGVEITKTVDNAYPTGQEGFRAGDIAKYTITVKNIGSVDRKNVVVKDVMSYLAAQSDDVLPGTPDGPLVYNTQTPGITYSQDTRTAEIEELAVNEQKAFKLDYTVQAGDIGKRIKNTATVEDKSASVTVKTEALKLRVRKIDMSEAKKRLAGAVFTLYAEDGSTKLYENLISTIDEQMGIDGYLVSVDGETIFELPTGTYYLVEEKAPDGFERLNYRIKVSVKRDGITAMADTEGGTVYETEQDGLLTTISVTNTLGTELPSTGGPGTMLYTLSGMMLLLGSALLYGFRRRHEERRSA